MYILLLQDDRKLKNILFSYWQVSVWRKWWNCSLYWRLSTFQTGFHWFWSSQIWYKVSTMCYTLHIILFLCLVSLALGMLLKWSQYKADWSGKAF